MAQEVPNRKLVVIALSLLGGGTKRIHTEDIALKCHELFPGSFSWTKYPEYPDKDIVRVALTDARKEKYGALVDGRAGQNLGLSSRTKRKPESDGWMLTAKGIEWINENSGLVDGLPITGQMKEHRQQVLKQLKRIRQHTLFSHFLEDQERFNPSIGDIAELLRCRVDAEQEVWEKRFDTITRKASVAGHDDILAFVSKCRKAYQSQK